MATLSGCARKGETQELLARPSEALSKDVLRIRQQQGQALTL